MDFRLSSHALSFSRRLFLSVIALFITFSLCVIMFQYNREKEYRIEMLNIQLQNSNTRLYEYLCENGLQAPDVLDSHIQRHAGGEDLRVTLIQQDGQVVYDNRNGNFSQFHNHLNRKEIKEAIATGSGYDIRRLSESVGGEFFYSAQYYPALGYIIRSALPYDISLANHLKTDPHYVWFTVAVSLILMVVFYRFTHKLGTSITQLQQFANKADRNEPIDMDIQSAFPKNELGEISQHIIRIYKRLHRTKEYLYIEREKLITHLQISHEGLGVFTNTKQEILVNSLFTQYINFISDKNLSSTEELFSIPELHRITHFINTHERRYGEKEEKRLSLHIEKNGRIFAVMCIIFQDNSFEISINDVTQEEEQARLKKQLTQNIAHELKTPVSSIQGYLETLVDNPTLPRERINAFLQRCYAQSNRLTHLLRDISVLTRLEDAPNMMEMEPVDLAAMMRNILNEVTLELEEKQISTENLLPDGVTIPGNASMLYSIFRNLTDNAIAYAGTGITLSIRRFREDEHFNYFSFSDTGVGVAPEHLSRLFERFYRVDKGRSRKLGGTGLGLAIVKNAVLLHGGSIFAKNNPGGGLEFIFTLRKGF